MRTSEQNQRAWQRIKAAFLSTALILGVSTLLALTLALSTSLLPGQTSRAWACGINQFTMLANNAPAIPVPGSLGQQATGQTNTQNLPGLFPVDYYRGQAITFTEDLSAVPNAPAKDSIQWRWDFGDGSGYASGPEPAHTYQRSGKFTITVSVYDDVDSSWNPIDTSTITILDSPWSSPPIAKATASKTLVTPDDSVTFNAAGSHAQVGSQVTYEWSFGDGSPDAQGAQATYQFTTPGRALVTLLVTDSRGAHSTAVIPIQIVIAIPQVHIQVSAITAQVGQNITFSSQVQTQPGEQIAKYVWDFGDQTPQQTTTSGQITYHYAKAGQYHAQVQAVDQQNVPGTATINITVQPQGAANGSNSSNASLVFFGLGALVVLAIIGWLLSSIWRRRPAPATYRRGAPRRLSSTTRSTPARIVDAGPGIQPRQSLAKHAPGTHSARPPQRPSSGSGAPHLAQQPLHRTEPPRTRTDGQSSDSGDAFLRD